MGFNTNNKLSAAQKTAIVNEAKDAILNESGESLGAGLTAIMGAAETIENLSHDRPIVASGKIYGVKFPLASYSGSPAGERTGAAVGLAAAVSTDETAAVNDFDNEPCFMFTRVNGYLKDDGEFVETAIEGDPIFKTDGTNGDVYVRWSTRFFRYIYTDTHEEIQITDLYRPNEGWCPYGIFIKPDGRLRRYAYIAAYEMSYNTDGKAASISGAATAHNTYANRNATTAGLSHNTQLTEIRKKGTLYCGMTTKEIAFLQDMFCVEFATRNSQSIMQGCTSFNFQKPLSVAETGVERVIVSNANAACYPVGCTISVSKTGASAADRNNGYMHTTVNRKRVISQEPYDANNTAINIDNGGVTFDTTTTMYITTMPWYTGMTDTVKGTSGSYKSNTNGYYPMKYRGVENLYGNIWTIMSDVIVSNYKAYICYDCTKFKTSVSADYSEVGYTMAKSNNWVKEMGHDANHPSVRLPITLGGSASTYYCDYYWISAGTNHELLFGGNLSRTSSAGVCYWNGYDALGHAYWYIGSRLSVSGRSGILAA